MLSVLWWIQQSMSRSKLIEMFGSTGRQKSYFGGSADLCDSTDGLGAWSCQKVVIAVSSMHATCICQGSHSICLFPFHANCCSLASLFTLSWPNWEGGIDVSIMPMTYSTTRTPAIVESLEDKCSFLWDKHRVAKVVCCFIILGGCTVILHEFFDFSHPNN